MKKEEGELSLNVEPDQLASKCPRIGTEAKRPTQLCHVSGWLEDTRDLTGLRNVSHSPAVKSDKKLVKQQQLPESNNLRSTDSLNCCRQAAF